MADRSFDIQNIVAAKKIKLNILPFMRGKEQLYLEEEFKTRSIASVRIHVKTAIERIKEQSYIARCNPQLFAFSVGPSMVYLL